MAKTSRKPRNLSLDDEAMRRGERYSQRHGTSVSRLVSDFLRALPLDSAESPLAPQVQRLLGVAVGAGLDRADYRKHLIRKHGMR